MTSTVATLLADRARFLAFVAKRVGPDDAEDVLQAAFARAAAHADEVRDDERVVAWFYRILRNAVADHWRGRAASRRIDEALAAEPWPEAAAPPDTAALCRCFEPLVATLPPDQARVLRRVDLEEARPVDVAAELGVTANAAMVRLHRARRALRERLLETCRACAEHGCLDCSCGPTRAL
ncbi:MAG: sigma-70 family RNA polymerase sigma factor [Vicinamibacteria bacterium]